MTLSQTNQGGERQTLASAIAVQLRQAIMSGDLSPGKKLHVAELREQFAVSLSPLREALSRLGSEGLLEIEDLRGYRVAGVSAANLTEVISLRVELEPMALRQAMSHAVPAWRGALEAALVALEASPRAPRDAERVDVWELRHRDFHFALLNGCQMPMLLGFLSTLHDLSDRYRRIYLQTQPPDRDVPREHRRIVEAAISEETEIACALLRQHIQRTGKNVLATLLAQRAASDRGRCDQPHSQGSL